MASQSKEEKILNLILGNSPLKEWHFNEIVGEAKVTRAVANKWLKRYVQEGLLKKIKEKGRFPYFTAGSNNPFYHSLKRVYALEQLHKSGLIAKLLSLKNARTVIIFGSIARGDWYNDSDIDIFVYGDAEDLDTTEYEIALGRNIELHIFADKEEIRNVKTGLIKNIINGYVVKGQIQDIAEVAS
ncbi:nucleotidyltransferase domain-containing protein [Candidatus Woesearchaeota archaeon]|nr:nucleotidyltransferase domain-containing protein [Candidatus Woesearchaeota archaeon]